MLAVLLGTTDSIGLPVSFHSLSQDEEAALPGASYTSGQSSKDKPNSRCFLKSLLKTGCPHFYPHHVDQSKPMAKPKVKEAGRRNHGPLGSMAKYGGG